MSGFFEQQCVSLLSNCHIISVSAVSAHNNDVRRVNVSTVDLLFLVRRLERLTRHHVARSVSNGRREDDIDFHAESKVSALVSASFVVAVVLSDRR